MAEMHKSDKSIIDFKGRRRRRRLLVAIMALLLVGVFSISPLSATDEPDLVAHDITEEERFVVDRNQVPVGYAEKKRAVDDFIAANLERRPEIPESGIVDDKILVEAYALSKSCQQAAGIRVWSDPERATEYTISYEIGREVSNPERHAAAYSDLARRCRVAFEENIAKAAISKEQQENTDQVLGALKACADEQNVELPEPFSEWQDIARISPEIWPELSNCALKDW